MTFPRLPATPLALALALAAGGASTIPAPASAASAPTGAIPWQARPADAPVAVAEPTAPPASHACAAAELQVHAGASGAWHGMATQELRITRAAAAADRCALDGAPALELVSDAGIRQAVSPAPAADAAPRHLDLGPGDELQVLVGTPGTCDAAQGPDRHVARRLRAVMPGGGEAMLEGVHVDTLCGPARVLHVERVEHEAAPAQAAARAPWAALQASVSEVEPAVAGGTLHYVVTLRNPGEQPVALAPCPAFTQSLHVEGRTVETHWRLACQAAGGQVPAHGQVAFEMRAAVPATMAGGGVKLAWTLQDGPAAGAIVPLP